VHSSPGFGPVSPAYEVVRSNRLGGFEWSAALPAYSLDAKMQNCCHRSLLGSKVDLYYHTDKYTWIESKMFHPRTK